MSGPTDDWFRSIQSAGQLEADAELELLEAGFVVIPRVIAGERMDRLALAYDTAVAAATPPQLRVGRGTTRVHGLVDSGPEFSDVYSYRPMLEACCRVIGQPIRLSSLLARTVHPWSSAQGLHVDAAADGDAWPMVGFILMVDAFDVDNGSTRFVPGSHRTTGVPTDPDADQAGQVLALGARGSLVIYNGSVWHGHSANRTARPRRSIQGAYVPRSGVAAVSCRPDTEARLGGLA
jgi:Phytanoyl-CoA dioxygenase (PhyH)